MTKKEMIAYLTEKCGLKADELSKKTAKELKEIFDKYTKVEVEVNEGVVLSKNIEEIEANENVDIEENVEKNVKEEFSPSGVVDELQPKIHEVIVRRFNPVRNLRIENLGPGDVYVGEDKENLVRKENKLAPGQGAYLENISVLYITSASRPVVRIIY